MTSGTGRQAVPRRRLRPAGSDAVDAGALLHGGGNARIQGAADSGGGSGWAKQSLRPSLRRTQRNHSADAPVPATTSATVTTVESIRNTPAGSVTIRTARAAVSSSKIPAHSQVAPWKK